MVIGFKRPGKIKKIAENNGLKYESSVKSNVKDLGLFGQNLDTEIKNYCQGNYRGKQVEFYDLIHMDGQGFLVDGETIIKIGNDVVWPKDYSGKVRNITKGVTKPEDIFDIIDKYIDNR